MYYMLIYKGNIRLLQNFQMLLRYLGTKSGEVNYKFDLNRLTVYSSKKQELEFIKSRFLQRASIIELKQQ